MVAAAGADRPTGCARTATLGARVGRGGSQPRSLERGAVGRYQPRSVNRPRLHRPTAAASTDRGCIERPRLCAAAGESEPGVSAPPLTATGGAGVATLCCLSRSAVDVRRWAGPRRVVLLASRRSIRPARGHGHPIGVIPCHRRFGDLMPAGFS